MANQTTPAIQVKDSNVGIGTNNPTAKLFIEGNDITLNTEGSAQGKQLYFRYSNGANIQSDSYLYFSTGGSPTEKMRITAAGNVGIGTTSPGYPLDIVGFANSSSGFRATNGTVDNRISWSSGNVGFLGTISNHPIALNTNATERVRITETGNVGIGTTSPAEILHLFRQVHSGDVQLRVENDGYLAGTKSTLLLKSKGTNGNPVDASISNVQEGTTAGALAFYTGGANERLRIASTGNVGIGTTSPAQKLEVAGALVVGMTVPAPFWNAQFKDFNDGSGIYISSVNGGGGKYIAGNAYYYNSTLWRSDKTVASAINLDNGTVVFYTNSGLTPNVDYSPTERMRITSAGNVGIGTTSPSVKLHTVGDGLFYSNTNTNLTVNSNGGVATLTLANGAGSQLIYGGVGGSNNMDFYTGSTFRMRIDPSGNVGIGTTSPAYKLDVNVASNSDALRVQQAGASRFILNGDGVMTWGVSAANGVLTWDTNIAYIGGLTNNALGIWAGGSEKVRITTGGNVGIGTTSPFSRLTVSGALSALTSQMSIVNTEGGHAIIRSGISGVSNNGISFVTADVDGSSQNVRMVVSATGNVGIGTTSPTTKLYVSGSGANTTFDSAIANDARLEFRRSGTRIGYLNWDSGVVALQADSGNYLQLNAGGSERLRITAAGDVGIGTTSPSAKLHVIGNATVSATLSTANAKISGTLADSFNQVGTAGQVLSSTGTGIEWVTGGGGGGTTITVKDEGTTVSSAISTLDFYGENVQATASGSTATISIRNNAGTGSQYLNDLVTPYVIPGSYVDTVNINGVDIIVPAPGESKSSETLTAILTFGILNVTGSDSFNAFYFRLYNNTTAAEISDTQHRWSSYMSDVEPSTIATFHIPIKLNEISTGDDIYVQCQTSVLDAPEIYYCALTFIKGSN